MTEAFVVVSPDPIPAPVADKPASKPKKNYKPLIIGALVLVLLLVAVLAVSSKARNTLFDLLDPKGSLLVEFEPDETGTVDVYLGETLQGQIPVSSTRLKTGDYTLRLRRVGYLDEWKTITIKASKTTSVRVSFNETDTPPAQDNTYYLTMSPLYIAPTIPISTPLTQPVSSSLTQSADGWLTQPDGPYGTIDFRLNYPESWVLSTHVLPPSEENGDRELTEYRLTQQDTVITFSPWSGYVVTCVYPGETSDDFRKTDLGEYTDIERNNGITWRRALSANGETHVVCERDVLSDDAFIEGTYIGAIKISGSASASVLEQIDEILKGIEIKLPTAYGSLHSQTSPDFSFRYPVPYLLTQPGVPYFFLNNSATAAVVSTVSQYKNPNYRQSSVLAVTADASAGDRCFNNNDGLDFGGRETIGGVDFFVAETTTAATGDRSQARIYRANLEGGCYEIVTTVQASSDWNDLDMTKVEQSQQQAWDEMDRMLGTFAFL